MLVPSEMHHFTSISFKCTLAKQSILLHNLCSAEQYRLHIISCIVVFSAIQYILVHVPNTTCLGKQRRGEGRTGLVAACMEETSWTNHPNQYERLGSTIHGNHTINDHEITQTDEAIHRMLIHTAATGY